MSKMSFSSKCAYFPAIQTRKAIPIIWLEKTTPKPLHEKKAVAWSQNSRELDVYIIFEFVKIDLPT